MATPIGWIRAVMEAGLHRDRTVAEPLREIQPWSDPWFSGNWGMIGSEDALERDRLLSEMLCNFSNKFGRGGR